MLINSERYRISEPVDSILESGDDLSTYYLNIDEHLQSLCWFLGVLPSGIPVDDDGYILSVPLLLYGTYYGIFRICSGYTENEGDVYDRQAKEYYAMSEDVRKYITKATILGGIEVDQPTSHKIRQGVLIV
jgi:hypothetical protein